MADDALLTCGGCFSDDGDVVHLIGRRCRADRGAARARHFPPPGRYIVLAYIRMTYTVLWPI